MSVDEQGNELPALPTKSTSVSIEEFISLKTIMETKMDKLQELLTKLLEAKETPLPTAPLPLENLEGSLNQDLKWKSEADKTKIDAPQLNQLMEHARVPFPYSPELPIPHPPIHLRGAPPSLNVSSFTN